MNQICEFCEKSFSSKSNLSFHQKTAKYCINIQKERKKDGEGKDEKSDERVCDFCEKMFTTLHNLQEHSKKCKKMIKHVQEKEIEEKMKELEKSDKKSRDRLKESLRKEYENKIDEKIEKQKKEYEEKLYQQKKEYEEKLLQQKKEYEEKLEKQQNVINTIAMRPSNTKTTNVVNNNNSRQQILNFNDKERLNSVIKNNVDHSVVKKGQLALANVVFQKYLKDDEGNQLYKVVDASRQNFEYIGEDGDVRIDIGEKKLTDAISKSNLTQHVSEIAKDIPNLYDKESGYLEAVIQLTNFEEDNSKFRKEMVRLAKV